MYEMLYELMTWRTYNTTLQLQYNIPVTRYSSDNRVRFGEWVKPLPSAEASGGGLWGSVLTNKWRDIITLIYETISDDQEWNRRSDPEGPALSVKHLRSGGGRSLAYILVDCELMLELVGWNSNPSLLSIFLLRSAFREIMYKIETYKKV